MASSTSGHDNDLTLSSEESDGEESHNSSASAAGHPIWKLFNTVEDANANGKQKVKCSLRIGKHKNKRQIGKPCNDIISDTTTVAMRHLAAYHPKEHASATKEYKEYKMASAAESRVSIKRRKVMPLLPGQQLLSISTTPKYPKHHPKQMAVTRKLAKAFVANSLATNLVENADFRDVLTELDKQYDPPSSHLLLKEEDAMFALMKNSISNHLEKASKVAITADIWTKRGGTESFFGVTAHWYDEINQRLMSATLAIQNIRGKHDAKAIYDQTCKVLSEWSIPICKISKVVTDNGSNMVKAFQESFQLANLQNSTPTGGNESENPQRSVDSNDDHHPSLVGVFSESDDAEIETEMMEFDHEEQQAAVVFSCLDRLSCFAHALQCCIRVLDKSSFACGSRVAAFKLMESFSHSPNATKALILKRGKRLLTACKTRWSYNCLALERLLELRLAVTEVTNELNINNLRNSEWSDIERYVTFTKPFADATYSIEGDLYTTLSQVIPALIQLTHHLNQVCHF